MERRSWASPGAQKKHKAQKRLRMVTLVLEGGDRRWRRRRCCLGCFSCEYSRTDGLKVTLAFLNQAVELSLFFSRTLLFTKRSILLYRDMSPTLTSSSLSVLWSIFFSDSLRWVGAYACVCVSAIPCVHWQSHYTRTSMIFSVPPSSFHCMMNTFSQPSSWSAFEQGRRQNQDVARPYRGHFRKPLCPGPFAWTGPGLELLHCLPGLEQSFPRLVVRVPHLWLLPYLRTYPAAERKFCVGGLLARPGLGSYPSSTTWQLCVFGQVT